MSESYEFTVDWFSPHLPNWLTVTEGQRIAKILEIGSFEGRSACRMIEHFSKTEALEVYCIDSWAAGFEHGGYDMEAVEHRFNRNMSRAVAETPHLVKVYKHKGVSTTHLIALLANGHARSFDLIFIDGSHVACDVMSDLVFAYYLCRVGGLIICDDYLWGGGSHDGADPLATPRPAVDAFVTLFSRSVKQIPGLPIYQAYLRKTA